MSQEYTEDKQIKFVPMGSKHRLIEALLILIALFAVYLMAALLSFNPSDPSWSQTAWHEPIHNLAGIPGAWLADTLLFVFGVMAYAIPIVLIGLCLAALRYERQVTVPDYFAIALRVIGALTLVITTCGLAAINADDIWYFTSGGIIGSLVNNAMSGLVSQLVSTLSLLCLWAAGFTLYTGWSWLSIAERIGAGVIKLFTFVSHRGQSRANSDPDYYPTEERYLASTVQVETTQPFGDPLQEDKTLLNTAEHQSADALLSDPVSPLRINQPYSKSIATLANQHTETAKDFQPSDTWQPARQTTDKDTLLAHSRQLTDEGPMVEAHRSVSSWGQDPARNAVQVGQPEQPKQLTDLAFNQSREEMAAQSAFELAAREGSLRPNGASTGVTTAVLNRANPQVKQGIGPELPRPNPIKIPIRRELASYGITLPSQRQQPEPTVTASNAELTQAHHDRQDEIYQAALAAEFARSQQSRYGYTENQSAPEHGNPLSPMLPQASPDAESADGTQDFASTRYSDNGALNTSLDTESTQSLGNIQASTNLTHETDGLLNPHRPLIVAENVRVQTVAEANRFHDSLLHPFLMRNDAPLEKPNTPLPTLDLLTTPPPEATPIDRFVLEQTARLVEARLNDFRVKAEVVEISPGPVITCYELDLAPGVKAARISNLSRDLARSLSAVAVRVVEVIPGKPYVGLELPNQYRRTVYLREVLDCPAFRDDPSPLTVVLGKDISGEPVVADLAKMPHLLVAGTTGSGKSVGVNAMILSMLYKATPEEVRFIMIDPKMLELSVYEGIPHLLTEVVTDMKDAANALRWSVTEMERRYKLMSALGVRNLAGYNERVAQAEAMGRPIPDPFWKPNDSMDLSPPDLAKLPYIVVMVDEFADLMMAVGKKVEELIARLAQKARAAGIHLVLATQRPSVDVITGLIKANIPTRIAFTVSSKIDSRTILDQAGAESLLGMGDMLYMPPNSSMPIRVHGAFVRDQEVHAVVQDWKARGRPQYIDDITNCVDAESSMTSADSADELDPLFDQAVAFVVEKRRASISGVQRQFRIGYNRAARIIEQMEVQGIVSEPGHNGNREVLAPPSNSI